MDGWLNKIVMMLLVIVLIAGATRLAWELLRPAVPSIVALLALVLILRFMLRGPKGW
jgi:hypothetical protein